MRHLNRILLTLGAAAAIAALPAQAESRRKSSEEEEGVQRAIAFQRAKDRADARQARLEARHPEHFTYAQPQNNPPGSLATEQKKEALDKADREAPPK